MVAGGAFDADPGGTQTGRIGILFALAANGSAVQAMGDDMLKLIAAALINQVKKSVTIDLNLREGARARIRVMVKRIPNKYGYPGSSGRGCKNPLSPSRTALRSLGVKQRWHFTVLLPLPLGHPRRLYLYRLPRQA